MSGRSGPRDAGQRRVVGVGVYTCGVSEADEVEEVDAIPVLAPEPVARAGSRALARSVTPTMQAAAVAAGGFVAGAAVVGLAHRHRSRDARALANGGKDARALAKGRRATGGRIGRGGRKGADLVQIVGTRSLLVDVHLLGGEHRGH